MTTALLLRYPEIFKVGVAGGPVIDWGYYEVMYGERYMDTPESNPEGYKECNLKNLAGQLKGHLLIIMTTTMTLVYRSTLSFMKACVDARTYPDLFIYRATSTTYQAATVYICTRKSPDTLSRTYSNL